MRNVLFLGSGSPFMKNAVVKNIRDAGYNIIECEPDMESIKEVQRDLNIVIVYFGGSLFERSVMVFLRDLVVENALLFYIIGNNSDLNEIRRMYSEDVVTAYFAKPLDVKQFVEQMDFMSNSEKYQKKKQILLVDDDPDYLKMLSGWLGDKYNVIIVNSGMQAITYLANHKPDLILLDYAMPVTDGPQVLEMIKSEHDTKKIPVIFLTGKRDKQSILKVINLEPEGYLLKSIGKAELLHKLEMFFKENVLRM